MTKLIFCLLYVVSVIGIIYIATFIVNHFASSMILYAVAIVLIASPVARFLGNTFDETGIQG